jgi:hypothetical protein
LIANPTLLNGLVRNQASVCFADCRSSHRAISVNDAGQRKGRL